MNDSDDTPGDSQSGRTRTERGADSGYIETRGPPIPEIAYKITNLVVSLLLRSPLHSLVSESVMLLTFTGAKTGNEYTTPVGYWVKDGCLIVTTHSPWWRNLKDGQPVLMRVQGQRREGVATPYSASEDVARYMQAFINRRGMGAARRLGIRIHGEREPTLDELEAGVEGLVVIEIELTDDKPPVQLIESDFFAAVQLRIDRIWDDETGLGLGTRRCRNYDIDRCTRSESCDIAVEFSGADIKTYGSSRVGAARIRTQHFGSILNLNARVS
jgi:deazaflavin-dependent oxidoreductase (nitroreductase family)